LEPGKQPRPKKTGGAEKRGGGFRNPRNHRVIEERAGEKGRGEREKDFLAKRKGEGVSPQKNEMLLGDPPFAAYRRGYGRREGGGAGRGRV